MGMDSIYSKPERRVRRVASEAAEPAGKTIVTRLNKDSIIDEHHIAVTLDYGVDIPIGARPNPADIGLAIDNVRLIVSGAQGGELCRSAGVMITLMSRLYEDQATPVYSESVPGSGVSDLVRFGFELEYQNDEAKRDMMAALDGDSATQVTLEITTASQDALDKLFGGLGTSLFSYEVLSMDYNSLNFVDDDGNLLDMYEGVASTRHFFKQNDAIANAAGSQEVMLEVGNMTRACLVRVTDLLDPALPVVSDDIVGEVSLVINGVERQTGDFKSLQGLTVAKRGLDAVGVIALDWGDDEFGFLNLLQVQQARLVFQFNGAGKAEVLQDYTI